PGATTFTSLVMNAQAEVIGDGFHPDKTTFSGDVVVVTGNGNDDLTPVFNNTFFGNVTFVAGSGTNYSSPFVPSFMDNLFNGNFSYIGGPGSDNLNMGETHNGSVNLFLGDGNNTLNANIGGGFRGIQQGPLAWPIAGNLYVKGGSGDDNLGRLTPTVGGNLT